MLPRILISLLIVAGLCGFGGFTWVALHPTPPEHHAAPLHQAVVTPKLSPTIAVLSAARMLASGTILRDSDLNSSIISADKLVPSELRDTRASRLAVVGALVRRSIAPSTLLTDSLLVLPGEVGFLAALLAPGTRAMTLSPSQITSDLSLIVPGDHVDLILLQVVGDEALPASRHTAAETLLTDVPVLALGGQLGEIERKRSETGAGARSLTLQLYPDDAERLTVALSIGKVALTLRPPASGDTSHSASRSLSQVNPLWAGDVASTLHAPSDGHGAPTTVHVFNGQADGKDFRF